MGTIVWTEAQRAVSRLLASHGKVQPLRAMQDQAWLLGKAKAERCRRTAQRAHVSRLRSQDLDP